MREFAKKHGLQVVETSVSTIFKELGYDPAQEFDFATRLKIQIEVLKRVDEIYAKVDPLKGAITDRTPLDMIAYTLAEATGDKVTEEECTLMEQYIEQCYQVLEKRFSLIAIVQPGIEIVPAEGKAAPNRAYIEHLNRLIIGCANVERNKVKHYLFKRGNTSVEDRIGALEFIYKQRRSLGEAEYATHLGNGGLIH